MDIDYRASTLPPVCRAFAESDATVRCLVGPFGSGKTTTCVRELARRALRQRRGPDGIRRTRQAVIRNTYRELADTTRKTFEQWIPRRLGEWRESDFMFRLKFADVESEILFRSLDRPEDISKLLSLDLTMAYVNEAREVPKHAIEILEARINRYPSMADGGASWAGIWMDTNPWHAGHWGAKLFSSGLPRYKAFRQPGGRSLNAENIENLPPRYYDDLAIGKDTEYIRVYIDGEDASGDEGSIFGAWISALAARGGISGFDHPTDQILTSWDLGHSDSTAIWWWRVRADGSIDVLDHYENSRQGLTHYFEVAESKGYTYAHHWLPHDAKEHRVGSQQTVLEQCAERWPGLVSIAPAAGIDDGIMAARWLLEQDIRIHERCDAPGRLKYSGLDALRQYRYSWDPMLQVFSRQPVHDWASHTADSFRYLALCARYTSKLLYRSPKPPPGPYAKPMDRSTSLDELWREHDRRNA
jgi:hypothetical protein